MDAPTVHSRVDGEGEKPSYMKKMKAKAKKLKDNVSAYRHQGQEQQVVHHAPVDDADNEEEVGLKVHDLGIGNINTNANVADPMKPNVSELDGAALNSEEARKTEAPREEGISLGEAPREYDHVAPKEMTNLVSSEREKLLGGERTNVEDDHARKSNSQADTPDFDTKIPDQIKSGDEEIEVTPVLHFFDEMNINAKNDQHLDNGTNDKISTENNDQLSPDSSWNNGGGYISSATSAIANSAISAKNVVASRLGYGGTNSEDHVTDAETPQVRETIQPDHNAEPAINSPTKSGTTYTEKLSSATYAIAGGAISAKNVVASKLGYRSKDQVHDNVDVTNISEQNGRDISTNEIVNEGKKGKGVSVKNYIVKKLSPEEEDKALSEVLSEKLKILKPGAKEETGESGIPSENGKVAESDEVKQRLENAEGNENLLVNKIDENVGSMLRGAN